jgi:SAM-dependent methyltransferase
MYDNTTPSHSPLFQSDLALNRELDRLVELAWEPGWAPMAAGELIRLCAALQQDNPDWLQAQQLLREHPGMQRLMQEDPLVFHAAQPAAVRLDLVLGHAAAEPLMAGTSRAGRDLFAVSSTLPWSNALRAHTSLLARMVDAVAAESPGAAVLTLGAGHLREAAHVTALHRLSRWVVLEEDVARRHELRRSMPSGVTLQSLGCSLRGFVRHPYRRGCFDLICLPKRLATWSYTEMAALVGAAFEVLKPGGRLIFCAAGAPVPEAAWMDVFMGRSPRWTQARDMEEMLAAIDPAACSLRQISSSVDGHIRHAILRRRGA